MKKKITFIMSMYNDGNLSLAANFVSTSARMTSTLATQYILFDFKKTS